MTICSTHWNYSRKSRHEWSIYLVELIFLSCSFKDRTNLMKASYLSLLLLKLRNFTRILLQLPSLHLIRHHTRSFISRGFYTRKEQIYTSKTWSYHSLNRWSHCKRWFLIRVFTFWPRKNSTSSWRSRSPTMSDSVRMSSQGKRPALLRSKPHSSNKKVR